MNEKNIGHVFIAQDKCSTLLQVISCCLRPDSFVLWISDKFNTDAALSSVQWEVQERKKVTDLALGGLLNKQNFTFYSEIKLDSSGNMCSMLLNNTFYGIQNDNSTILKPECLKGWGQGRASYPLSLLGIQKVQSYPPRSLQWLTHTRTLWHKEKHKVNAETHERVKVREFEEEQW